MSYIDLVGIISCAISSFLLIIGGIAWIYVLLRIRMYANKAEILERTDLTEVLKKASAESGRAVGLAESAMESVSTLGAKITQRHKREDAAERKKIKEAGLDGPFPEMPLPPGAGGGGRSVNNRKRLVRVQR